MTWVSFIEEDHASKLASKAQQDARPARPGQPSQGEMAYWGKSLYTGSKASVTILKHEKGYKFEAVSLLPKPWAECSREDIENREGLIVSNYAQYCSVVETGSADLKIILGGEVDAVWDSAPPQPGTLLCECRLCLEGSEDTSIHVDKDETLNENGTVSQAVTSDSPAQVHVMSSHSRRRPTYVELKTTAEHDSRGNALATYHNRKLLKFWAQSFLLGVSKIIVGFRSRDEDGRLLRLETMETTKIPAMVREWRTMRQQTANPNINRKGESEGWESSICIAWFSNVTKCNKSSEALEPHSSFH